MTTPLLDTFSARKAPAVDGFEFNAELGSQDAVVERVGDHHYKIRLGVSPSADGPRWVNRLQFEAYTADPSAPLRLDVSRPEQPAYYFNEYAHSMSHDYREWSPLRWQSGQKAQTDTLIIPPRAQERFVVGNQVPMSPEMLAREVQALASHPAVSVSEIGRSIQGRPILRLTITDPEHTIDPGDRTAHYVSTLR